jgi:oligopeptide/dipeptide ABC transporter ATP-binding protein
MGSIPEVVAPKDLDPDARLPEIAGMVPALWDLPAGCAFAPRCKYRDSQCDTARPPLETAADGRRVACWHPLAGPA